MDDYLKPRDPGEPIHVGAPFGGGPVLRNPARFDTTSPIAPKCRSVGSCDGDLIAPSDSGLNPWPLKINCPKCGALHIFVISKGEGIYGMAL